MTAEEILSQHNLVSTRARLAVINTLKKADKPIDVASIVTKVNKTTQVDQATIYRIIDTLTAKGVITKIDLQEGKFRYELTGDHHHHLSCQKCGKIIPIFDKCIAFDQQTLRKKYAFTMLRHQLEIFGLCNKCQDLTC